MKQNVIFDPRRVSHPLGGLRRRGQKVKIQLFQNDMLHIKIKGITNAATCFTFRPPRTPLTWGWSQKVEIPLFQNMVMLQIKLKRITNAAKAEGSR